MAKRWLVGSIIVCHLVRTSNRGYDWEKVVVVMPYEVVDGRSSGACSGVRMADAGLGPKSDMQVSMVYCTAETC